MVVAVHTPYAIKNVFMRCGKLHPRLVSASNLVKILKVASMYEHIYNTMLLKR